MREPSPPTTDDASPGDRKADHIRLALEERMQVGARAFDAWTFGHRALPEIDLAEVDLSTRFLGKPLRAPILVSCMTGGTEIAARINRNLAVAAEGSGIALGVGSQRKAIEDPDQAPTFQVRPQAPSVPLLANLGAVQLNYGYGLEECRRAVDMIGADALVFHLNPLQEAIQPEGQTDFADLLPKIREVCDGLGVPVVAKEVGSGLSREVGESLAEAGVSVLDTAGVGGTSWARIEARRSGELDLGEVFAAWGIPTPDSIRELREIPGVTVVGSGGLRTGVDAAKALALGADLVGMAYPFLQVATESADAVEKRIERIVHELKIAMFCLGCRSVADLRRVPVVRRAIT